MGPRDKISFEISQLSYLIGTLRAKVLVKNLGEKNAIHFSVKYWQPSKIKIGNNSEIRHGSSLDARSKFDYGIKIGNNVRIKEFVCLAAYGGEISIENNVLIGRCSTLFGTGKIIIGAYSMISPHTTIISTNHVAYLTNKPFQELGFTREIIEIGSNVWIGANCSILAGSTIEPDTVVGAGAVVTGTLKSGWIYGGIPAKPIKALDDKKPNKPIFTRDWGLLK